MEQEKCMHAMIQRGGKKDVCCQWMKNWKKLNKGFDELIKWDKMVAKSQKQNAENKRKFQNIKLDESFDTFDINQA